MTSSTRATRVHNRIRGHNPPSRFRSVTFAEADRFRKTVLPGAVRVKQFSPSDLVSEVARLRRENERLRMERDILKKAALIFGSASR